jgi:hypothetical protein
MSNSRALLDRYDAAMQAYVADCSSDPSIWHRPNVEEFSELYGLLTPYAEAGEMLCQYALATILWAGLRCESEEKHHASQASAKEEATRWWIAAARRGYWPALDNLFSAGVGKEADLAREAFHKLERERPDLVWLSSNVPIYGDEFVQELSRRLYGRVTLDANDLS